MTDTMELVVARADVKGGEVEMEVEDPGGLEVKAGSELLLKFPYKLKENSREREEYRFLLRTRVDGQETAPASLARWGDQWGWPDEVWGTIQQRIPLEAPGEHVVDFEVLAEYIVAPWGSTAADVCEREEATGRLVVTVR